MKKIKIFDIFLTFGLCFIIHNLYEKIPCFFISIFSPVNESIFEHMKLFNTSLLLTTIFDYIIFKKKNINFNNLFLNLFISIIFSISSYLIIYIPIYNKIGENMIFSISLLFIIICITQYLSYYIYKNKNINIINYISLIFTILIFILFTYLSYNPIFNYLFFDIINNKYGINFYI